MHARIHLIGYRGTGKTTVGRLVAARLGWTFVDADVVLEARSGKPISRIFAEDGEPIFRDLEAIILNELCSGQQQVLATGGGVVGRATNRELLRTSGFVVWLEASPELLWQRIHGDATTAERRPNLTSRGGFAEVAELVARREPWYRETAHLIVDAGRSPETVSNDIVMGFHNHLR